MAQRKLTQIADQEIVDRTAPSVQTVVPQTQLMVQRHAADCKATSEIRLSAPQGRTYSTRLCRRGRLSSAHMSQLTQVNAPWEQFLRLGRLDPISEEVVRLLLTLVSAPLDGVVEQERAGSRNEDLDGINRIFGAPGPEVSDRFMHSACSLTFYRHDAGMPRIALNHAETTCDVG